MLRRLRWRVSQIIMRTRPMVSRPNKRLPKGHWLACKTAVKEIKDLGRRFSFYTKAESAWRVVVNKPLPAPQYWELVVMKWHIDHNFSFSPWDFFLEVRNHYVLHLYHLPPNSILVLSSFVALCDGYLGIQTRLDLFQLYFGIKQQHIKFGGSLATAGAFITRFATTRYIMWCRIMTR
jgi:hypothetical protein